jgi:hypothetical protein
MLVARAGTIYSGSVTVYFTQSTALDVLISTTNLGYVLSQDPQIIINKVVHKNSINSLAPNQLEVSNPNTTSATIVAKNLGRYTGQANVSYIISNNIQLLTIENNLGQLPGEATEESIKTAFANVNGFAFD